ncbi:E3 ubiquitin-protein ligase mib1, partial [Cichlidogyrus casuarinus]
SGGCVKGASKEDQDKDHIVVTEDCEIRLERPQLGHQLTRVDIANRESGKGYVPCQATPWLVEETRPDGLNALHLAILNARAEVVDLLLQAGISASNCTGSTAMMLPATVSAPWLRESRLSPLHLAVHRSQAHVLCLLLCHGASPTAHDCKQRTPLDLALQLITQQNSRQKRLDISLVPFLASVSRLLIRMTESFNSAQDTQLHTPSTLYQRIHSTVHASLETGISRLVLIAACLAASSGFEKGFQTLSCEPLQ